jgi:hypothetical protein
MFCHRCGTKNPDDAFFCHRCGTALIRSPPEQIQPQQITPQQVIPQQIPPQQVKPQQVAPRQINPQQPSGQGVVADGAPERAVYGVTQEGAHPVLLLFEVLFSAVFAGLFSVIISRNILQGTMSSLLMAASLVTGFIIIFAGIHYGKVLRK